MKIIIIDPSIDVLKLLLTALEQNGYETQGALDPFLAGNVVRMGERFEMVMVNYSFCFDPIAAGLQQLIQEINNPYLKLLAISDIEDETVCMRVNKLGFHGLLINPINIKSLLKEIERVAELGSADHFMPASERSIETKLRLAFDVIMEIVDEKSKNHLKERSITQDISKIGATVLTMLNIRVGEFVAVKLIDYDRTYMAIARGGYIGSDRIKRINLQIIDNPWPEFFNATFNRIVDQRSSPPIAAPTAPTNAQILGNRYQIQNLQGEGGLGAVYRAIDLSNQRTVAIKLLLNQGSQPNEQQISRQYFEREIAILSRINHPNIVAILDSGICDNGQPYLVMEYIEGTSLREIMLSQGIWTIERTLHLLKQICPALHALHLKNIIHRDLKPANIIIEGKGASEVAMLLDLGIAKNYSGIMDGLPAKPITQIGTRVGTIEYMSPEQCLEGDVDHRADIYSLGIMIYELLAGQLPFDEFTIGNYLMAHIQTAPPPLRTFNSKISEAIERVVNLAIAKEPVQRPKTALEFLQYFEEAANLSDSFYKTQQNASYFKDN